MDKTIYCRGSQNNPHRWLRWGKRNGNKWPGKHSYGSVIVEADDKRHWSLHFSHGFHVSNGSEFIQTTRANTTVLRNYWNAYPRVPGTEGGPQ